MKRILMLFVLVVGLTGCSPKIQCDKNSNAGNCLRVLFIGNSYTYVNDLPGVFSKLADSGKHLVETGMLAQGGWSLADHVGRSEHPEHDRILSVELCGIAGTE